MMDFTGEPKGLPLVFVSYRPHWGVGNERLIQRAMTSTAFDTSVSGIQAATVKMQANASNVANANTDGYEAKRVDMVERPGGVEARIASIEAPNRADAAADSSRASLVPPPSNVNLADEMVSAVANENFYQANLQALKAADDMMGTLLDTSA